MDRQRQRLKLVLGCIVICGGVHKDNRVFPKSNGNSVNSANSVNVISQSSMNCVQCKHSLICVFAGSVSILVASSNHSTVMTNDF